MNLTVKREHVAWIAIGIFILIVVAYFWSKNQIAAAFNSGEAAGLASGVQASAGSVIPGLNTSLLLGPG